MIEMEPLEKTIALTLQSAYVKNSKRAVSLLIVANPEHGKTQTLLGQCLGLIENKKIFYTNSVTAKFIEQRLLNDMENGKIRHIVIPDLLNCIERAQATRKLFVNFMKSLIEEGIVQVGNAYGYYEAKEKPVKCGLITAITKGNMQENFMEWRNIGFMSRVITFSYKFDVLKITHIFDSFLSDSNNGKANFVINDVDSVIEDIDYPEFRAIGMTHGMKRGETGIRYYENLVYLARSNAKLNNRSKVEKQDVEEILRLTQWFNLDYNIL